jgi:hypothetical protein
MIYHELRHTRGRKYNCRNHNHLTESYVSLVQSQLSYYKIDACKIQLQKHQYNAKNMRVLVAD